VRHAGLAPVFAALAATACGPTMTPLASRECRESLGAAPASGQARMAASVGFARRESPVAASGPPAGVPNVWISHASWR
jgi:hypothetical protein